MRAERTRENRVCVTVSLTVDECAQLDALVVEFNKAKPWPRATRSWMLRELFNRACARRANAKRKAVRS